MRYYLLCIILFFVSVSGTGQEHAAPPPVVSMIQLLASPEKYDGKVIAVLGFLTVHMEGNTVYLGKNDYDNGLLPNSIWISVSDGAIKQCKEVNMKYGRVVGTFHLGHVGHRNPAVGGLAEVSSCAKISDPDHPMSEVLRDLVHRDKTVEQQVQPK